jgi:hypothetical protein
MTMTPDDHRNERLKLMANWSNTIATAIVTVGTFIPIAQFIYGILPAGTDPNLVNAGAFICLGMGLLIHLAGQWFLGGLR